MRQDRGRRCCACCCGRRWAARCSTNSWCCASSAATRAPLRCPGRSAPAGRRTVLADRRPLAHQLPRRRGRRGHPGRARHPDARAADRRPRIRRTPIRPQHRPVRREESTAHARPQDSHPRNADDRGARRGRQALPPVRHTPERQDLIAAVPQPPERQGSGRSRSGSPASHGVMTGGPAVHEAARRPRRISRASPSTMTCPRRRWMLSRQEP